MLEQTLDLVASEIGAGDRTRSGGDAPFWQITGAGPTGQGSPVPALRNRGRESIANGASHGRVRDLGRGAGGRGMSR
jgi:hypothetical protein